MSDNQKPQTAASDDTTASSEDTRLQRVFKIGSTLIVEDEGQVAMSNEQVRDALAFQYPEVANATISTAEQDGRLVVEFMHRPGRKG
jgi:PRTRC genetic system protein C